MLELVVVLAILTLLFGMALPNLRAYYRTGKEIERQKQEEIVQKAINQYFSYQGHYPYLGHDPNAGEVRLTEDEKEFLRERLKTVTDARVDTGYDYYYNQTRGTIRLEPAAAS